eukprot:NODE_1166_length_1068_cov_175.280667_g902_i0.p2 GENE.NODE_1166_length_1068_cov_175.280667_g902_i0~~NODE_1166_length_1068_cov_175.280667_g902_i0.p2  ORF type:complete len:89 (+),score=17.82 NODE_1166_length_1068_cov_175.280667_g902_i0:490-756(+)
MHYTILSYTPHHTLHISSHTLTIIHSTHPLIHPPSSSHILTIINYTHLLTHSLTYTAYTLSYTHMNILDTSSRTLAVIYYTHPLIHSP